MTTTENVFEKSTEQMNEIAEIERNGKELHSRSFIKANTNFAALNVYISDKLSSKGTVIKQFMCFNFREKIGHDGKNTIYAKKDNKEGYATFAIAETEIDHLVYLIDLFLWEYKTLKKGGDDLKRLLNFVNKNGIKLESEYNQERKQLGLTMNFFHKMPDKNHKKSLNLKFLFSEDNDTLVFTWLSLGYNGEVDGVKHKFMQIIINALELFPIQQLAKNCY